jgi:hypothetical protein
MRSNSSDIVVVDAADCGSGGGSRISKAAVWIWRRGGRPMRERRPSTMRQRRGVSDVGSGAVWEASAGGDQTESFELLMA